METDVSIPDPIFRKAEQYASERGLSRDDLYARALDEYLHRHQSRIDPALIQRINAACEKTDLSLDEGLAALQDLSLPQEEW